MHSAVYAMAHLSQAGFIETDERIELVSAQRLLLAYPIAFWVFPKITSFDTLSQT